MIYELRTYQLAVGGLPEYLEVARTMILPGVAEYGLKPVGFWYSEIGQLNEVVHLWAYNDLNERQEKWSKWARDPRRGENRERWNRSRPVPGPVCQASVADG